MTDGRGALDVVRAAAGWRSNKMLRSAYSGDVLHLLRDLIVAHRLTAGTRLVETNLADEFGVSRGPVRSALSVLEAEGLVETLSNGRMVVATFGLNELESLFRTRFLLESAGIEWGLREQKPAAAIMDATEALADVTEAGPEFVERDIQFHLELVRFADSRFLLQAWMTLAPVIESVIRLGHKLASDEFQERSMSHINEEHRGITEAIVAGDRQAACDLLNKQFIDAIEVRRKAMERSGAARVTIE
ncbi:MAG TPA: GntR family transcriptional regulator [Candidatus Saccharimonadales bacterium]|nr:GntR family transcriptional regulator [Candidatus Saccharimonadales bacterium]